MKKKLLAIMLCIAMVAAVVSVLTACDDDSIVVWVSDVAGVKELTERQIERWNETNEFGVKFKAKVYGVSEKVAAGDATSKPQDAADIFCFASDQLARLVQVGVFADMLGSSITTITNNNLDYTIEAAKIGGVIRAFPLTADNTYLMYYDTRYINASSLGSLEDIIDDCVSAGKKFSMNLTSDGSGWYGASFFYAEDEEGNTLCVSDWETDERGYFVDYNDTYHVNGTIALEGMSKLFKSGVLTDSDNVSADDFNAASPSAVVISGIWDYNSAQAILGNNLGVAALPSFTVEGKTYRMIAPLGSKLMGVKKQTDGEQAAYLQRLAAYLTSEECQKERFTEFGWGPTNVNLTDPTDTVKYCTNAALDALRLSCTLKDGTTILQSQYPGTWWGKAQTLQGGAKTGTTDFAGLLTEYHSSLTGLLTQNS